MGPLPVEAVAFAEELALAALDHLAAGGLALLQVLGQLGGVGVEAFEPLAAGLHPQVEGLLERGAEILAEAVRLGALGLAGTAGQLAALALGLRDLAPQLG